MSAETAGSNTWFTGTSAALTPIDARPAGGPTAPNRVAVRQITPFYVSND
jgi:hypothetical protein